MKILVRLFLICLIFSETKTYAVTVTTPQISIEGLTLQDREAFEKAFNLYYTALINSDYKVVGKFIVGRVAPAYLGRLWKKSTTNTEDLNVTLMHYNFGWMNKYPAFSVLIFISDSAGNIIGSFVDVWFTPQQQSWKVMHFEDSDFMVLGARLE
jgi:hypothetical protein